MTDDLSPHEQLCRDLLVERYGTPVPEHHNPPAASSGALWELLHHFGPALEVVNEDEEQVA